MSLKSLADAVLERNRQRNRSATKAQNRVAQAPIQAGRRATPRNRVSVIEGPSLEKSTSNRRPVVFEYVLAGEPGPAVLICPPGSDLDHARKRLEHQFGRDRVIEVRDRSTTVGEQE